MQSDKAVYLSPALFSNQPEKYFMSICQTDFVSILHFSFRKKTHYIHEFTIFNNNVDIYNLTYRRNQIFIDDRLVKVYCFGFFCFILN